MNAEPAVEIKFVTGTQVYLDQSGEAVITIGYAEIPGTHQTRIVGSFAASTAIAEKYCRQLMKVLGIKEDTRWVGPTSADD